MVYKRKGKRKSIKLGRNECMKNTYLSREIIPKKINKTSINVAKRMVVNKPQPSSLFIYRKA